MPYATTEAGWPARLARKFAGDGVWISSTLVLGISLIAMVVISTPLLNDDIANINIRANTTSEGQDFLGLIVSRTSEWMNLKGRFFPGSVIWTYGLFWLTQNVVVYKLILVIVLGAAFATVVLLIRTSTGNSYLAAVFGLVLIGTLAIRVGHDALISYTGLVPLVIALTAGSALSLMWGKGRWFAVVAAMLMFSYALVTYEVAILLTPIVAVVTWIKLRKPIAYITFLAPAAVQIAIMLFLRSNVTAGTSTSSYSVSLQPGTVLLTFAKQASAALPLSQWVFTEAPGIPHFSTAFLVLISLIFFLPALVSARLVFSSEAINQVKESTLALMAFAGVWLWFSTSALTAITVRWQVELVWGVGYLNVVFGYFGLALCLASALCWIEILIRRGTIHTKIAPLVRWSSAGLVALLAVATIAGNFSLL